MSEVQKISGDVWKLWLLHRRDVTDEQKSAAQEAFKIVRDRLLNAAQIDTGNVVLDVGTGTGLVAFGALEQVGASGTVIFNDISLDCLEHCQSLVEKLGLSSQCRYINASIENLSELESGAVDVVTMRSVIIYTKQKQSAFDEFHRVLKPGGRLVFFEPINRFSKSAESDRAGILRGYDLSPVVELVEKVKLVMKEHVGNANDTMLDFDERDLLDYLSIAGFSSIKLEYGASIQAVQSLPWNFLYPTAPNPLALSIEEAARIALTDDERAIFENSLRQALSTQTIKSHRAHVYVTATK